MHFHTIRFDGVTNGLVLNQELLRPWFFTDSLVMTGAELHCHVTLMFSEAFCLNKPPWIAMLPEGSGFPVASSTSVIPQVICFSQLHPLRHPSGSQGAA